VRIEAVAVEFPSRRVTNEDIIREIEFRSKKFSGNLSATLTLIRRMLEASGSVTRTWLSPGESSLDVTLRACRRAIASLGIDNRIDLLIDASVHSELIEPATSNLIAHELGLDRVECFDLKEACDGWMKAAKMADALTRSGRYRRILVVNQEFSLTHSDTLPKLFDFSSREQLKWRFPALTVGEAAAATIFRFAPGRPWHCSNTTHNELFDLCTITPPWYGSNPLASPRIAKDGPCLFTSYGLELRAHGLPLMKAEFQRSGIKYEEVDVLFTHSSSKSDWMNLAVQVGLGNKLYDIYARCGNVVSAAIPAAMALASEDGTLKPGHRVLALVASAGMSFSLAHFTY